MCAAYTAVNILTVEWKIICSRLYRYFTFSGYSPAVYRALGEKNGREGDSVKCVIGNKCNAFLNSWNSRCLLGNLLINSRPLIAKSHSLSLSAGRNIISQSICSSFIYTYVLHLLTQIYSSPLSHPSPSSLWLFPLFRWLMSLSINVVTSQSYIR
jgi:hypothetical protein